MKKQKQLIGTETRLPKAGAMPSVLSCVWVFCDLMDYSPPGSFVYGIFQEGILKWVAIISPLLLLLSSHSVVSDSLQPHGLQHARLHCPSPSPGACSNSCPLSQGCRPTISSSVVPLFSCLQSFPASGSFLRSQFITSGGQSIEVLASVLSMNIQNWFPLGLTGWISLQSKGLSRVFSNTTVQKHQLFDPQPSLWSNSHIHIWPLEKP